jgi:hypothetical protein
MDTENQERGKQRKQPHVMLETPQKQNKKIDLTAVRHLLLEGLVRSLLPNRGGLQLESHQVVARGPMKAGVVLSFSSDP